MFRNRCSRAANYPRTTQPRSAAQRHACGSARLWQAPPLRSAPPEWYFICLATLGYPLASHDSSLPRYARPPASLRSATPSLRSALSASLDGLATLGHLLASLGTCLATLGTSLSIVGLASLRSAISSASLRSVLASLFYARHCRPRYARPPHRQVNFWLVRSLARMSTEKL